MEKGLTDLGRDLEQMALEAITLSRSGMGFGVLTPEQVAELTSVSERLKKSLGVQMMQETLDDVCAAVGYKPDHQSQFSGDHLVALIRRLNEEHAKAIERLIETEEVTVLDGKICWRGSGNPLHVPPPSE